MEQRQRVVEPLLALAELEQPAARRVPVAHHELVLVAQDATLRPARGAGGVEEAGLRRRIDGMACGWVAGRLGQPVREVLEQHVRNVPGALGQCPLESVDARLADDCQRGRRVLEDVGGLGGPQVGVDGNARDPERVQRELVQEVLGPVLHVEHHPVAVAVASRRQRAAALCDEGRGVGVAGLVAARMVRALLVGRADDERVGAVARRRLPPDVGKGAPFDVDHPTPSQCATRLVRPAGLPSRCSAPRRSAGRTATSRP